MSIVNIDENFSHEEMRKALERIHPSQLLLLSPLAKQKVLVACSGGADSIALAIVMRAWDIDFALAYIEHGLNPQTAECEVLVKNLANNLAVPFVTAHLDMSENNTKSNIEATARSLRYSALEQLRITHGYNKIVTAHHLDDCAETFLINLVRGGGSGMSSLAKERGNIVRPLLDWRKTELVELVESVGLEYFSDPMNDDPRFVRNRMRNEVLPLLNDIAQRDVTPLIARAAEHLRSDSEFLASSAVALWPKGEPSTRTLMELDPVLRVHALRAWITGNPPSNEEMERILDVAEHTITSTQISGHRTIWRSGAVLYQDVTPPV